MNRFFKLFRVLDRIIENILKDLFHAKREQLINKAIIAFAKHNPDLCDEDTHQLNTEYESALRAKFEVEIDRVYSIVDRSVLRDRIWRAKYTFFGTAITSVIIIGSLGAFTSHSALPFISPLINASIAWVLSVATISISYFQRIKGGLDTVTNTYVKELNKDKDCLDSPEINNACNDVVLTPDKFHDEETSLYIARALGTLGNKSIDELIEEDSISDSIITSEDSESINQDLSDNANEANNNDIVIFTTPQMQI